MHLLTSLLTGFADAAGGMAVLTQRGSSQPVQWYRDHDGQTAVTAGTPVDLDDHGRALVYVDEMTKVNVFDASGIQVIDAYVEGVHLGSVEIRSAAALGTDYETAEMALRKPLTLQRAIDQWLTDNGAPLWKVLVGGDERTIQSILSEFLPETINVKSDVYAGGAVGDGATDDTAAVLAAISAAEALDGAIVYFPPGQYLLSEDVDVPAVVNVRGAGPSLSRLQFVDSGLRITGTPLADTGIATVQGISIDLVSSSGEQLVTIVDGAVLFRDCEFNESLNSTSDDGAIMVDPLHTAARLHLDGCVVNFAHGATWKGISAPLSTTRVVCYGATRFVTGAGTLPGGIGIEAVGPEVTGCVFDTGGEVAVTDVFYFIDGGDGGTVVGCDFKEPATFTGEIFCLNVPDASSGEVFTESGNRFGSGDAPTRFLPYRAAASAVGGYLGSRPERFLEVIGDNDDTFTCDFLNQARLVNKRTAGGAQEIDMPSATRGPDGSRGTLVLDCSDVSESVVFTWGASVAGHHDFVQLLAGEVRVFEFDFRLDGSTMLAREVGDDDDIHGVLRLEEDGLSAASVNQDFDIAAIWSDMPADSLITVEVDCEFKTDVPSYRRRLFSVELTVDSGYVITVVTLGPATLGGNESSGTITPSLSAGKLRINSFNSGGNIIEVKTKVSLGKIFG